MKIPNMERVKAFWRLSKPILLSMQERWNRLTLNARRGVGAAAGFLLICCAIALWNRSPAQAPARSAGSVEEPVHGQLIHIPRGATDKNPISVTKVQQVNPVEELLLPGRVETDPEKTVIIGARTNGRVENVYVHEGDSVRKGQRLVVLQSAQLGGAQSEYLKAQARFVVKKNQFKRAEELLKNGIISAKDHENVVMEYKSVSSEVEASRVLLRAMGLADNDIAALEKGEAQPGRLTLYSPISGTVMERHALAGQAVRADDNLLVVGDFSRVWVVLNVYEREAGLVNEGSKVEVFSTAGQGESSDRSQRRLLAKGKVSRVSRFFDSDTRAAEVRLEVHNAENTLFPGQTVTARVEGIASAAKGKPVNAVPLTALQQVEGKTYVFLKRGDQEFEARPVEVGWKSDRLAEIRSGLQGDEWVVSQGAFTLKSELLRY